MMCHGCGGVVGRDCFNPQECEHITRAMADQGQQDAQDLYHAQAQIAHLQSQNERLLSALKELSNPENVYIILAHAADRGIDSHLAIADKAKQLINEIEKQ